MSNGFYFEGGDKPCKPLVWSVVAFVVLMIAGLAFGGSEPHAWPR